MSQFQALIMGANFRPPAKAILESLRAGVSLELVREPTNQYDPHAVQVWVSPHAVHPEDREELEQKLAGYGKTLEDFDETSGWFVGYVAKAIAANVSPLMAEPGASPRARLSFTGAGKPQMEIDFEE